MKYNVGDIVTTNQFDNTNRGYTDKYYNRMTQYFGKKGVITRIGQSSGFYEVHGVNWNPKFVSSAINNTFDLNILY